MASGHNISPSRVFGPLGSKSRRFFLLGFKQEVEWTIFYRMTYHTSALDFFFVFFDPC